ncbi:MAG: hypothetical protein ACJAQ6_001611 [Arenicella sp.]|jgi:hypothetical protein
MSRLAAADSDLTVDAEARQDADFNCNSSQLKRLAEHLNLCRQQRKTATYLEVADAISVQAPQRIHRLTMLLEALMEHDKKHHQPLRAALVVSRSGARLPAEGFFLKAQALNLMQADTSENFHQQCLNRLFGCSATSND